MTDFYVILIALLSSLLLFNQADLTIGHVEHRIKCRKSIQESLRTVKRLVEQREWMELLVLQPETIEVSMAQGFLCLSK